jgi:hypothetical protein
VVRLAVITPDNDIVLDGDAVSVTVVDEVLVLLIVTVEEPDAVIVFELVIVAVFVFVLGPVIVIFIEAVPDTETVDVLLGAGDLVFVIVLNDVGDTEVVDEVVFDVFAVAVVVGVKVDVFEPADVRELLGEAVDVLDEVIVPVLVRVIIDVIVGFVEDDIDEEPDDDLEADTDLVFVGVPEEVLDTGGDLL